MSCRLPSLAVFSLLFLFSINLTHAQSLSPPDYGFPEIDGSAVDDTCLFFSQPDTTETEVTPPPITTEETPTTTLSPVQVVTTTEKPTVQTPDAKDTGAPVTPVPKPAGPVPDSQSDLAARLLAYLLSTSGGGQGYHGYSVQSDSDEEVPTPVKTLNGNRWNIGLFSSDFSDES